MKFKSVFRNTEKDSFMTERDKLEMRLFLLLIFTLLCVKDYILTII